MARKKKVTSEEVAEQVEEASKKKAKKKAAKKKAPKKTTKAKKAAPKKFKAPDRKIKVLAYCDAPTCATGFATVSRNILGGLYQTGRFDIDILGINYWGDPHNFPFRIWPTGTNSDKDPYGRKKCFGMIPRMDYDILFFLQDSFILDFLPELHNHLRSNNKKFRSICYFPVDGVPEHKWMSNVDACDYTVAYSEWGKKEAMRINQDIKEPLVIPHGVNTRDYFILPEKDVRAFRAQYFGHLADKFIFTNLNRNQQRKDIPRTIAAFAEFRKHRPDSILYLHMAKQDQGWDLVKVVENYGLDIRTDVIFPENFGPNQGYPRNIVNMIYNISDCVLSTTLGEGWGLSWTEAMATGTPVIMPNNTALTENITEDRGWLADSGTRASLYTVVPNDNEVVRPLVDTDDLVKKMIEIHDDPKEAKKRAANAYSWATTKMEWQSCIVPQWVNLFDKAFEDLHQPEDETTDEVPQNKVLDAESF